MGLKLMNEFPSYYATIKRLDSYLDSLEDGRSWTIEGTVSYSRSKRSVLTCSDVLLQAPDKSLISHAELSQPLVTAIQIGIVNLLHEWNVTPRATVGHSSGMDQIYIAT